MCDLIVIGEDEVHRLLKWDCVISAVRQSLVSVTTTPLEDDARKGAYKALKMRHPKRTFMAMPNRAMQICMSGYLEGLEFEGQKKEAALTTKVLNIFDENTNLRPPLPTLMGYLYLYDERTGKMQAVIGASKVTEWRTAAVTCEATRLLWPDDKRGKERRVLAIMGAGEQGRIHAIGLQDRFEFEEIRIWNRTSSRAEKLVEELKGKNLGAVIKHCPSGIECVQGADVIVTATPAVATIVQDDWVKAGAHINAIGVGPVSELSDELYKRADVYVESRQLTAEETPHQSVVAELGELELKLAKAKNDPARVSVFQSRGMGIHDSAMARLVYNLWRKNQSANHNSTTSDLQMNDGAIPEVTMKKKSGF